MEFLFVIISTLFGFLVGTIKDIYTAMNYHPMLSFSIFLIFLLSSHAKSIDSYMARSEDLMGKILSQLKEINSNTNDEVEIEEDGEY